MLPIEAHGGSLLGMKRVGFIKVTGKATAADSSTIIDGTGIATGIATDLSIMTVTTGGADDAGFYLIGHSYRRAIIGSTLVARRAGM